MNETLIFFERIFEPGGFYEIVSINKYFKKLGLIKTKEFLLNIVEKNKKENLYLNIHPLKPIKKDKIEEYKKTSKSHRHNKNIMGFNNIGLDVEYINKENKTSKEDLKKLGVLLVEWLEYIEIKNYLMVCSGNGFHIYIFIDFIEIDESTFENYKELYKKVVLVFDLSLKDFSKNKAKCSDRKDLSSLLRIPGSFNKKANREVFIYKNELKGSNNKILNPLFEELAGRIKIKNNIVSNNKIKFKSNKGVDKTFQNILNIKHRNTLLKYFSIMNDRHNILFRDLGNFIKSNPELLEDAIIFTKDFKKLDSKGLDRTRAFMGWVDSSKGYYTNKYIIKWIKEAVEIDEEAKKEILNILEVA